MQEQEHHNRHQRYRRTNVELDGIGRRDGKIGVILRDGESQILARMTRFQFVELVLYGFAHVYRIGVCLLANQHADACNTVETSRLCHLDLSVLNVGDVRKTDTAA